MSHTTRDYTLRVTWLDVPTIPEQRMVRVAHLDVPTIPEQRMVRVTRLDVPTPSIVDGRVTIQILMVEIAWTIGICTGHGVNRH